MQQDSQWQENRKDTSLLINIYSECLPITFKDFSTRPMSFIFFMSQFIQAVKSAHVR